MQKTLEQTMPPIDLPAALAEIDRLNSLLSGKPPRIHISELNKIEGVPDENIWMTLHDHYVQTGILRRRLFDLEVIAFDLSVSISAMRQLKGESNGLIEESVDLSLAALDNWTGGES